VYFVKNLVNESNSETARLKIINFRRHDGTPPGKLRGTWDSTIADDDLEPIGRNPQGELDGLIASALIRVPDGVGAGLVDSQNDVIAFFSAETGDFHPCPKDPSDHTQDPRIRTDLEPDLMGRNHP
jgi:hypothetical protein